MKKSPRQVELERRARLEAEASARAGLCGKPLYRGFNVKTACFSARGHDGPCAPALE